MSTDFPIYVLITPARNEVAFIELTIQSVLVQTAIPRRWVIVSDGSSDGTDDVVRKYAARYPWIELVHIPERSERHFAGKIFAFNAGYARCKSIPHDIVASLDADITFDKGYLEFLLRKFIEHPRLGVAGTPFQEANRQYDYRFSSIEHVSGACQMFRRECFEDIGGYVPIKTGGVDLVAVITARMKGWQTRSFLEKSCEHHRKMGTANHNTFAAAFARGKTDYTHGCDVVWEFFRSCYQMTRRPVVIGGSLCLAGYLWGMMHAQKVVSEELVQFRKAEQRRRLVRFFRDVLTGRSTAQPELSSAAPNKATSGSR